MVHRSSARNRTARKDAPWRECHASCALAGASSRVFFFSSRRRHTRCSRDWSSDVCSSDLDHPPEMLDLAVLVGRALHGRKPRGDVADLLALIADALQIGYGLDDRHDHAQVTGRRGARREDTAAVLVDGDLHVVHLVVIEGDRLPERAVALYQRGDGLVQLLLDEAAHAEHLAAHALEVLVEATRDVVTEVGGFHQLASPASLVCRRAAIRAMIAELRPTGGASCRESKPWRWSAGEADQRHGLDSLQLAPPVGRSSAIIARIAARRQTSEAGDAN